MTAAPTNHTGRLVAQDAASSGGVPDDADLSGAAFRNANPAGARFKDVNMRPVRLDEASLAGMTRRGSAMNDPLAAYERMKG